MKALKFFFYFYCDQQPDVTIHGKDEDDRKWKENKSDFNRFLFMNIWH